MTRLTALDLAHLTPAQQAVHDQIAAGPRGKVTPSFLALLHSPALAGKVEQLGVYVRFQSTVPARLREFAILIVSHHWRCAYEWHAHASLATLQGITADTLNRIGRAEEPVWGEGMEADRAVHGYCTELLRTGHVGEKTYGAAMALLGEQSVVDLTALVGYYTLLGLTINAHGITPPVDAEFPWRPKSAE
ncbi:MAG: carboxymuconolactone decarboxylase family protein [Pseudomonadota bacterium]|nr:carboxymuconolactone decarboxylase family protein [Pseudomonadota bacterium]